MRQQPDRQEKLRFSWRGLMVRNRLFVKDLNLTIDARDGFARSAIRPPIRSLGAITDPDALRRFAFCRAGWIDGRDPILKPETLWRVGRAPEASQLVPASLYAASASRKTRPGKVFGDTRSLARAARCRMAAKLDPIGLVVGI